MKFVELKKNLSKSIMSQYLVEGEDRFVVNSAVKLIEKSLNLTLPDLNKITIESSKQTTIDGVLDTLQSYPMMDEKKLIILKDFTTSADAKKLEEYLKKPNEFIVLVVVSYAPNEFTKKIKPYMEEVDCSFLDETTLKNWIGAKLARENKTIEQKALEKLILYTSGDMARIDIETSKLIATTSDVVTTKLIDEYVVPDKDYQLYELAEFLAKDERENVFDLVGFMLSQDKNNVGIIQYLYGAFKRLLVISLSSCSDDELSKVLGVKPYAVKKARIQAGKFTPKRLKRINSELSNLEYGIKAGKVNQDASLSVALCKILLDK